MIGKIQITDYKITKSNLLPMPEAKFLGNPFENEKLAFNYFDFILTGIDINFSFIGKE
mgnify:CR=1 FL=1